METIVAALLILHGLITAGFSLGCFKPSAPVRNPAWLRSWPLGMGQSWLLTRLRLEQSPAIILCGFLFLASGLALISAGFGLLGFAIPASLAAPLALVGAGLGFYLLLLYFHPFYLLGMAVNVLLVVAALLVHWPSFLTPGLKVIESVQLMF